MIPRVLTLVCVLVVLPALLWLPRKKSSSMPAVVPVPTKASTPDRNCCGDPYVGIILDDPDGVSTPTPSPTKIIQGAIPGNLIERTVPIYPPEAKAKGIEGAVVIQARITKDGTIKDLKVLSGPEALAPSAIEAVSTWHYRPYLLKGKPVEVDTQITVNYQLGHENNQASKKPAIH
jgi:TonB family protein